MWVLWAGLGFGAFLILTIVVMGTWIYISKGRKALKWVGKSREKPGSSV